MFTAVTNPNVMENPGTEDGWMLNALLHTQLNSGRVLPDGVYTINDKSHPGTARIGGVDNRGNRSGSWVIRAKGGRLVPEEAYPLHSGTITSTYADGVLTFEVDARTADGTHVTGTVRGDAAL